MRFRACIFSLFLALAAMGTAAAYPGSVNLIPCADMVGAGNVRAAYESDGTSQPFKGEQLQYFYTEFGIGDRCEVGVDLADTARVTDKQYNAKFLLCEESKSAPAVAVGTMFVGKLTKPSYYAVGCRTFGTLRLHAGGMTAAGDSWALIGADKKISKSLTLLGDYQSGAGHLATLGIFWQANTTMAVDLYYAWNNTPVLADSDFMGVNVAYTFGLK